MRLKYYLILVFGVNACIAEPSATSAPTTEVTEKPFDMTLMNETISLIATGDKEIQLLETKKNLTLLVGLTGSGKSTMSHFLGDRNMTLEAYVFLETILIRDAGKKISDGNGSFTSKTLFPELIEDYETGEAMYDCPGFQDTRNTSVEIANGFFIKKLVGHAESIKILVIVKHESVKIGASRALFTSLVKQLLQFMRNVPKYKGAIALLATKVDSAVNDTRVMNMMASFLKLVRPACEKLFPDRKADLDILFDSWLEKDSRGNYVNLDFFRQPTKPGMLSGMPQMRTNRHRLRQMVFNNTHFKHVPCNASDFGIPLTGDAIADADIQQIQLKLKDQLNEGMDNLSAGIRERVNTIEAASSQSLLPAAVFETLLKGRTEVKKVQTVEKALPVVLGTARSLNMSEVSDTVKTLNERFLYLKYLNSLQPDEDTEEKNLDAQQLRAMLIEMAEISERNVRSRLDAAIKAAFQTSKVAAELEMVTRSEDDKILAVYNVAEAAEEWDLNALDFVRSAEKVLDLNNNNFNFSLDTALLTKVVELLELLPNQGELTLNQTAGLQKTLREQLENVVISVGSKVDGVASMFPLFGRQKCSGSV